MDNPFYFEGGETLNGAMGATSNQNTRKLDDKDNKILRNPSSFFDGYQKYLIKMGYSLYTPSNLPSTVFEYQRAVSDIKSHEQLDWYDFCDKIDSIIAEYDSGGKKEYLGNAKHRTWINALKRFKEYICFLAKGNDLDDTIERENTAYSNENTRKLDDKDNKIRELKKKAEMGDAVAQLSLGDVYYNAEGVGRDFEKALEWYKKSACNGNVDAAKKIGDMYRNGEGMYCDYDKAFFWWTKAANQGNTDAQILLEDPDLHKSFGDGYYYGEDVVRDYDKACAWYEKAADLGNEDAKDRLKELSKIEILTLRSPVVQDGYLLFHHNGSLLRADENGMRNTSLSWANIDVIHIAIFSKNEQIITDWGWRKSHK